MSTQNSTTVRFISQGARVFPGLFEPVLAELFFRAPARYKVRPEEAAVLARSTMSWVDTDSGRARIYTWGHGPRILLVHGYGGAAAQMTGFVSPLLAKGLSVVALDAPGHGKATGAHSTLASFASALSQVMTQLGSVHGVITHSMGGAALLLAASRHGARAKQAVLISPPSDVRPWYGRFVDTLALSPELARRVQKRIERRVGIAMDKLKASEFSPVLGARVLVIHDQDDKEVPHQSGVETAHFAGRAQLLTTTGLGHRRIVRDPMVIGQAVAHVSEAAHGTKPSELERLIDHELFHRERLPRDASALHG